MSGNRQRHWEKVYSEKAETDLSWHQDDPAPSLAFCDLAGIGAGNSAIDIGGGRSRLAERLLDRGLTDVTVLDLSQAALEAARRALGPRRDAVTWINAGITEWLPQRTWDLWHDRAVFHFLTEQADRDAYIERLERAVRPGGHAIIATFALDGPERCSGLPVQRYSPESLGRVLGPGFERVADQAHLHSTPSGRAQSFQFSLFLRKG
ncbi:methyltransferase domain-containing protein [Alphaproteobacteria bacterium GH1-50]|uniref:Methyltransferase domain-containing protein n=2 Tax=Kangsaoukella pontilimi TaxID=2691042 RepID=A0A7C9MR31_9RHOB|nr:methyltransferase domain-containing protein [Kangsaoukella pontilimi]